MKIKYLGHACFVISSDTGTKIITDPYRTGANLTYGEIQESADIVTVSHDHFDHNNVAAVRGNPDVVRGTTKTKGVEFKAIPSYHDEAGGKQRGSNTILCFEVDGIKICHLGDLGHNLNDKQVAEVGKPDVLLIPVGGYYTIDAKVATDICSQIKPRVIIPMHFKTDKGIPAISGVEEFLQGKTNIGRLNTSEIALKEGQLPATTQIMVLASEL